MRFSSIQAGEKLVLEAKNGITHLCCCDCGLVHKVKVTPLNDGGISLQFYRDNRSTAQIRRHGELELMRGNISKYKMERRLRK